MNSCHGLWALDVDGFSWPLLHLTTCMPCTSAFLHLTRDAASCPFPPAPDLPPARSCCPALFHFAFPTPGGCFPTCTVVPHSYIPLTHAQTHCWYICFCRDFHCSLPILLLPLFPFKHGSRGWPGRKPGVCIHLSCSLLLKVSGQGARGQARRASSQRQSWNLLEGWSSVFRSFLALLPRKSCQWEELAALLPAPPAPRPWSPGSALGPPASESRLSCAWSWLPLPASLCLSVRRSYESQVLCISLHGLKGVFKSSKITPS